MATAKQQIDFSPRVTNVRLLRQGLGSRPYWFVNMSTLRDENELPRRLVVVKIDANTGKVLEIDKQR